MQSSEPTNFHQCCDGEMEQLFTRAHHEHMLALCSSPAVFDAAGLAIAGCRIATYDTRELMRAHAGHLLAGRSGLDVLEIGFGLGMFAEEMLQRPIGSYTVVEPHRELAARATALCTRAPTSIRTNVLALPWQLALDRFEQYDVIMYDGISPDGYLDHDFRGLLKTLCHAHLRRGGRFSCYCTQAAITAPWILELLGLFSEITLRPLHFNGVDYVVPVAVR